VSTHIAASFFSNGLNSLAAVGNDCSSKGSSKEDLVIAINLPLVLTFGLELIPPDADGVAEGGLVSTFLNSFSSSPRLS